MENYTHTTEVRTTADLAYEALTRKIPLWWSEMFNGSSSEPDDVFTVKFGDNIYKTFRIKEAVSESRIVWYVVDSLIGLPELKNQTEWIGTTIIWEMEKNENGVLLRLTHRGLHSAVECFNICSNGWV